METSTTTAATRKVRLKAQVKDFSFFYGSVPALKNINLKIAENRVTALIGPSLL